MKLQLYRDYNSLSKRTQLLAGFVNTAIGVVVIMAIDLSLGTTLETSLFRIAVAMAFGTAVLAVYAYIQKRRMAKSK